MTLGGDVIFTGVVSLCTCMLLYLGSVLLFEGHKISATASDEEWESMLVIPTLGGVLYLMAAVSFLIGFLFAPKDLFFHDIAMLGILAVAAMSGKLLIGHCIKKKKAKYSAASATNPSK